ncbi:MAG: hypothetical protein WA124_06640 [Smithella sp.]|jgi:hypothetical protein
MNKCKRKTRGVLFCLFLFFYSLFILTVNAHCAEGIKGKANIPVEVKEKKFTFTNRLSKNGPELKFEMYGKFKNGYLNKGHINVVNVSNAKRIQKIIINDNFEDGHFDWDIKRFEYNGHEVQMVDVNFDGYLDLRLLDNAGATGNDWYSTYIYDRSSGKFKYHHELSQLSGITIDQKMKQIITYNREGACAEYIEYYGFARNKLVLLKAKWTEIDRRRDKEAGSFGCFMYTGTPRNADVKIDPSRVLYPNYFKEGESYIRKRMKDIKETPLQGNLDGRERGPLGNPM